MARTAFQSVVYACLGLLIAMGGFVGCPCGHAEGAGAATSTVVEAGHGCCSTSESLDEQTSPLRTHDDGSDPCTHCDGPTWIAECVTPVGAVAAVSPLPADGTGPAVAALPLMADEMRWGSCFSAADGPPTGATVGTVVSLRALSVLLTV